MTGVGALIGPGMTRRTLLAASLLPLVACTSDPEPAPAPDPDDLLREQAVERELSLLRDYDAVLLVLPDLAPRVGPLRAEHVEHLTALSGAAPESAGPSAAPSAGAPLAAPLTPGAALAGLIAAERAAAAAHGSHALQASRQLAGLLAALSASEQSHPVALA